ncbi:hypothetical protein AXG93_1052s1060 [Marchantia polymorpha subsp. ruderalis]|uniref:Uncharacterized protein n=1 Tax=Marchantia polymorpha subsp. ruderalis TaxID=1480154 RepID=A0A176VV38_MARPO|nr:hypothetical protein AXG93_1052s1060 [Marchantia polymorpha subsp. ruderalis]
MQNSVCTSWFYGPGMTPMLLQRKILRDVCINLEPHSNVEEMETTFAPNIKVPITKQRYPHDSREPSIPSWSSRKLSGTHVKRGVDIDEQLRETLVAETSSWDRL